MMLQKFRLIPYVLGACFLLSSVNEISYPIKTQNTRNTQAFSRLINITMPFTFTNQTFFPVPDSTAVSRLHIYPDGYSQTSALHSKLIRHHTVPVSKSCPKCQWSEGFLISPRTGRCSYSPNLSDQP